MGGASGREKALQKIIKQNKSGITDQDLEEIMMNTQFSEFELVKLHKKFMELDTKKRGKLTNREFLQLEELQVTPFRARLKYAFPLKSDEEVAASDQLKQETLKVEDYNDFEELLGKNDKTVDKLNENNKTKEDMKTGMEDAKQNLKENDDEDAKEERKESNNNHEESKHEFGQDEDEENK